jgi:hypothetical protein
VAYSNRGSFEVWVDGVLETTVNAYSTTLVWQKAYTSLVYTSGLHTVVIKKVGSSGTFTDVDAIQIINPDLIAPDVVTSLTAVTGTANGSIDLSWVAPANDAGNLSSGAVTSYLVRYSLSNIANETDWNAATAVTSGIPTPGLPGASQAMTVIGLTPDTMYYIAVRGQDTGSNLGPIVTASAVAKAPEPLGVGKYDDTHAGWTYTGTWQLFSTTGPYNNTNHYTTTVENIASFTFNGSQFVLSYVAYSNRGSFEVWVDGVLETTVNAYSTTLVWQKAYTSLIYTPGVHTVVIKKVGSSGTFTDVDAIQILP